MTGDIRTRAKGPTRRQVMKVAAAGAGLALGSGLVRGFPTIWAQNIKDVKLVQVGGSYSAIIDIGKQASKDLGFKVEMQTADHAALLNRLVNEPKTIDIADIEYFFQYFMVGRNIIQPIPLNKYKWWDKTVPIFTKGEYPDGRKVSAQGTLPYKVQYSRIADGKNLRQAPDGMADRHSDRLQRRHARHPPRPPRRPVEHWSELLNPEFKGKSAIVDVPSIGIMDAAMAIEVARRHQIRRQGQHDQRRDRQDDRHPDRGEESRSVPRVLEHLR